MPDIEAQRKTVKELLVSRLRVLRHSADQFLDERTVSNRLDAAALDMLDDELDNDLSTHERLIELQKLMQRYSLMSSILTNIANMKHESLKGIAANLRG